MTSHPFDLVSPDMAGTTVDEGGLVQEQSVEASGPPQACPGPLVPGPPRAGRGHCFRAGASLRLDAGLKHHRSLLCR
ncbi:MAG: hypothetical protein QOI01_802 [Mycobacterium sp.]|jgi:hypothetical protein|nr:hypothetical protein [Mycobacterium sp.]